MSEATPVTIKTTRGLELRAGIPTDHPRLFVVVMPEMLTLTHGPTGLALVKVRCTDPWSRGRQTKMLARLAAKVHAAGFAMDFTTEEDAPHDERLAIGKLIQRATTRWKGVA